MRKKRTLVGMRRLALLIAIAAVAGCGQDPETPDWKLLPGIWGLELSSSCRAELSLEKGTNRFIRAFACAETGNIMDVEKLTGTFVDGGGVLDLNADQATCADAPRMTRSNYEVDSATLVISTNSGSQAYTRYSGTTLGSVQVLGCFAGDGTFTPSPLAPL